MSQWKREISNQGVTYVHSSGALIYRIGKGSFFIKGLENPRTFYSIGSGRGGRYRKLKDAKEKVEQTLGAMQ